MGILRIWRRRARHALVMAPALAFAAPGLAQGIVLPPVQPSRFVDSSCIPSHQVTIDVAGEQRQFCLRTAGLLVPRLLRTDAVGLPSLRVDTVTALTLLADRRFEPIWPALERAMGPSRTAIRDGVVREAQEAYTNGFASRGASNTLESVNSGPTRLVLDFALALSIAGRTNEAIQLVQRQLPDVDSRRRNFDTQFDWMSLKLREAQTYFNAGMHSEALAALDQIIAHRNIRRDLRVNAMVNKAAMLAEFGQAAEALTMIDAALEIFEDSGLQLAGSDRQFAWIRACALHHLGRSTEAEMALAPLRNAPELVGDPGVLQPPTSGVSLRAALCLGDDAWVAQLAESSNYLIDYFVTILQPNYRMANPRAQATLVAARERLAGTRVMERFRILPESYRAALNNWIPARLVSADTVPAGQ